MMKRGFKKQAEEKSMALRKEMGTDCYSPINCLKLAEHLDITVLKINDLTKIGITVKEIGLFQYGEIGYKEFSASILSTPFGNIMIYNHFHSLARTNSNMAHEVSHIVCNHDFSETINGQSFGLIREFPKEQEDEANWLAGCILLPRQGLVWAAKQGMSIKNIAEHFETSEKMASWRYYKTGIKNQVR